MVEAHKICVPTVTLSKGDIYIYIFGERERGDRKIIRNVELLLEGGPYHSTGKNSMSVL